MKVPIILVEIHNMNYILYYFEDENHMCIHIYIIIIDTL